MTKRKHYQERSRKGEDNEKEKRASEFVILCLTELLRSGGYTSVKSQAVVPYAAAAVAAAAAAAAKLLQLCPTLCDPIDSSPPGSPVPGILQVRTLEWVAISFSNA